MPGFRPLEDNPNYRPNRVNYENIPEKDLRLIFKQLFDLRLFKTIDSKNTDSPDKEIYSNRGFWNAVSSRDLISGQLVKLKGFMIIEWIPFSPGLYFTDVARIAREEAENYVNDRHGEYTPLGKFNMINGGLGSLRLRPQKINGKSQHILGATTTGISHQGLPLLMNDELYNKYIDQIKSNRTADSEIIGRIRFMPEEKIIKIQYPTGMPNYCVEVEEIINKKDAYEDVYLSIAISYRTNNELKPSWTYAMVESDRAEQNIVTACNWLHEYMYRYSEQGQDPKIMNNFDEHMRWFRADFELKSIIENKEINTKLLIEYLEANNISLGENVIIGNGNIVINNVKNSTIDINKK